MQNLELSPVVRRAASAGRAMALAITALLCMTAGTATAATTYKLEFLEDLPGKEPLSVPTAINADGQAVGVVQNSEGTETPVYWNTSGHVTDLSLPAGPASTLLGGINQAGDVALSAGGRVYLWNAGVLRDLTAGTAFAINDLGQLVGSFGSQLAVWTDGVLMPLPAPGNPYVYGMNNRAEAVGMTYFSSLQSSRGVLWRDGAVLELGTLPGDANSSAAAINDLGQVVGYSVNSSGSSVRGFLWENGAMTDLGLPAKWTYPHAINNAGQIVGSYQTGAYERAFVLQHGVLTDLTPVLATDFCTATDINDIGQIVGYCRAKTGQGNQAFRLTPAQGVDVGVAVTKAGSSVVGEPLVFTATIANVGGEPATGVEFQDTLPAGFVVTALSTSQGTCSADATISCALGDLAVGTSATVRIETTPTLVGKFANLASVSVTEEDANPHNNSSTVVGYIRTPSADPAVSVTDSPDPVRRSTNLTYTIQVRNNGPATATDVRLSDSLPSGMSFVSLRTTQGSCSGTSYVTCTLGDIASGASANVTIVVRPRFIGKYTNYVSIGSATPDSNGNNNYASVVTTVVF